MTLGRWVLAGLAALAIALPAAANPKTSGTPTATKSKAQTKAAPARSADYLNCVQYVKKTTDFALAGDAWRWWDAAAGHFNRGKTPKEGAILVFKKTDRLRYGHVAVVSSVVGPRRIEIDHANWAPSGAGKGKVTTQVGVEDISPKNDWSLVRVWYGPANEFGKPYPTYGFILPKPERRLPVTVLAAAINEAPEISDMFVAHSDGSIGPASRVAVSESPRNMRAPRP